MEVSDARKDKKLGEVGDPNTRMVDVSVEEDPSAAVYERLQAALTKLGFSVVPYSDAMETTLQVEIRSLVLKSVKTAFTFETELRAEVGAHAANGPEFYDRQFSVRTRKDGAAPPFEEGQHHAGEHRDLPGSRRHAVRRAVAGTAR